jgi:hypothetical protein
MTGRVTQVVECLPKHRIMEGKEINDLSKVIGYIDTFCVSHPPYCLLCLLSLEADLQGHFINKISSLLASR